MSYTEIYLLILISSFGGFIYLSINGFGNNPLIFSFWISSVIFIIINEIVRYKGK